MLIDHARINAHMHHSQKNHFTMEQAPATSANRLVHDASSGLSSLIASSQTQLRPSVAPWVSTPTQEHHHQPVAGTSADSTVSEALERQQLTLAARAGKRRATTRRKAPPQKRKRPIVNARRTKQAKKKPCKSCSKHRHVQHRRRPQQRRNY